MIIKQWKLWNYLICATDKGLMWEILCLTPATVLRGEYFVVSGEARVRESSDGRLYLFVKPPCSCRTVTENDYLMLSDQFKSAELWSSTEYISGTEGYDAMLHKCNTDAPPVILWPRARSAAPVDNTADMPF